MDIRALEKIRVPAATGVRRIADELSPAFAVDAPRMEDDSYNEAANQQNRGMEEEDDPSLAEESKLPPSPSADEDDPKQVDFFA